jgi:hypothetical protein
MSAAMKTVQNNSVKMKRMTGTVYNLMECSLRATQHVILLLGMWNTECRPGVRSTLTGPEEEEEGAEHQATFLDALKRLGAARKYMRQFDTENNN